MTDEYLYRCLHGTHVTRYADFNPDYDPDSRPYACCEMGGGMFNAYRYRFVLPLKSVDAMANIKIGSGCNFWDTTCSVGARIHLIPEVAI